MEGPPKRRRGGAIGDAGASGRARGKAARGCAPSACGPLERVRGCELWGASRGFRAESAVIKKPRAQRTHVLSCAAEKPMKKILLGCLLLMAAAGCPNPFAREGKDRPEPPERSKAPGDPNLEDSTDPACRFCGARGTACCPKSCREVSGVPLNSEFCLHELRCLPPADGGEQKFCVE
jgi:hypothetical protein